MLKDSQHLYCDTFLKCKKIYIYESGRNMCSAGGFDSFLFAKYACNWGAADAITTAPVGTCATVVILLYKQGLQHIIVGTISLY